jgi:hypothetical protein
MEPVPKLKKSRNKVNNYLSLWSTELSEKVIAAQLVKKVSFFRASLRVCYCVQIWPLEGAHSVLAHFTYLQPIPLTSKSNPYMDMLILSCKTR